jgi:hypothetical protein
MTVFRLLKVSVPEGTSSCDGSSIQNKNLRSGAGGLGGARGAVLDKKGAEYVNDMRLSAHAVRSLGHSRLALGLTSGVPYGEVLSVTYALLRC